MGKMILANSILFVWLSYSNYLLGYCLQVYKVWIHMGQMLILDIELCSYYLQCKFLIINLFNHSFIHAVCFN